MEKNRIYGYDKTKEQKIKWLKLFFAEYPLKKEIASYKEMSLYEIDELYYQYQSHCAIHNIQLPLKP